MALDFPFKRLPDTVTVNGKPYKINTDFRIGIATELEADQEKPDIAGLLTEFYMGQIPNDVRAAMQGFLWFWRCGKDDQQDGAESKKKRGRWYDFQQDADVLLSSFLSAYGINLQTAELHWWTFRKLMVSMPYDTLFMERVRYRTADLSDVPKEQRAHYRKMKSVYAIKSKGKKPVTVEERDAAWKAQIQAQYEAAKAKLEAKQKGG